MFCNLHFLLRAELCFLSFDQAEAGWPHVYHPTEKKMRQGFRYARSKSTWIIGLFWHLGIWSYTFVLRVPLIANCVNFIMLMFYWQNALTGSSSVSNACATWWFMLIFYIGFIIWFWFCFMATAAKISIQYSHSAYHCRPGVLTHDSQEQTC